MDDFDHNVSTLSTTDLCNKIITAISYSLTYLLHGAGIFFEKLIVTQHVK